MFLDWHFDSTRRTDEIRRIETTTTMKTLARPIPTVVLLLCLSLAAPCAQGQQTIWKRTVSFGDWFIASNWSAGVPTSTTDAVISLPMEGGPLIS
jgi:hypothetical protein